jgi:hypothetical protein
LAVTKTPTLEDVIEMHGRPGTTDNPSTHSPSADSNSVPNPVDRGPTTLGGWVRATAWGALAVAGSVAALLLVAPGEIRGAEPSPCEQVRDQVDCPVVQLIESHTVPTWVSTPGQVPFARSPSL